MAGATISIKDNSPEVLAVLDELQRHLGDMAEPMHDIGEYLLGSFDDRWAAGESSDGTPWAPLSPEYAARKSNERPNAGILEYYGNLRRLVMQADSNSVTIGTPYIYGASMQFGDGDRNIPARPFLGLSRDDEAEVVTIAMDYLRPNSVA